LRGWEQKSARYEREKNGVGKVAGKMTGRIQKGNIPGTNIPEDKVRIVIYFPNYLQ